MEDLKPLAADLQHAGYHTCSFSFSGHGNAPFNADFGIEQFTIELENFILKNNIHNATVFGYSMGGFVALNLAKKNPDLIKKIITLGTKFNWSKEVVEKETRILNAETMQQKAPAFAEMLKQKHGIHWENILTRTADMMRDIEQKKYLLHNSLQNIKTEVLIGLGDRDRMVSYEETAAVYKSLPNAGMYMLAHASHGLETVNTKTLSNLITAFLNQ